MKIAIATEKDNLDSRISPAGGRAPYYLILENGEIIKSIDNPFKSGGGGAGWSVAQMLADEGVEKVFLGKIGGNMEEALKGKGIGFEIVEDKIVKEII